MARGAHQIFRVTLEGEVELFAGTGERGRDDGPALEATFSFPNDIDVAPDGTLYVNEIASTTGSAQSLAPMIVRRIRTRAPTRGGGRLGRVRGLSTQHVLSLPPAKAAQTRPSFAVAARISPSS